MSGQVWQIMVTGFMQQEEVRLVRPWTHFKKFGPLGTGGVHLSEKENSIFSNSLPTWWRGLQAEVTGTRLCSVSDMLKRRDAIQWELERWICTNPMNSTRPSTSPAPELEQSHRHRLSKEWIESSHEKRYLGYWWKRSITRRLGEVILSFYPGNLWDTLLEDGAQLWGPQYKKDVE